MVAELTPSAKDPTGRGAPALAGAWSVDPGLVLEQLGDSVIVADETGTILMANAACEALLGYRPDDLVGHPLLTIVPARLAGAHQAGFSRYVTTHRSSVVGGPAVRVGARRADGSELPVELRLAALDGHDQAGVVVVATLRDLSERIDLERQALVSRLLQASVDASRDGVLAVSSGRRVLAVNRRFCEMWRQGNRRSPSQASWADWPPDRVELR